MSWCWQGCLQCIFIGTVSSIERNHEQVELARTGEDVCIKIENTTGEAPKLYGRHFTHEDTLVSRCIFIGTVSSIERNHEQVELARTGEDVCIKIENTTGEAPKLYGRHFTHEDTLLTRETIDVCKEHFREDLTRADWQLVISLKKVLGIL
ncbi:unnamed protein product [Gongylonema pulchrum]|uniref:FHA domain-containing protein n=1 Tax=Gongylonema pulchrum TaxID=637853 RepID=A0A183EAB3_9BILA|nr:unnamed protein product [Gongylonema pulchrum]